MPSKMFKKVWIEWDTKKHWFGGNWNLLLTICRQKPPMAFKWDIWPRIIPLYSSCFRPELFSQELSGHIKLFMDLRLPNGRLNPYQVLCRALSWREKWKTSCYWIFSKHYSLKLQRGSKLAINSVWTWCLTGQLLINEQIIKTSSTKKWWKSR